MPIPLTDLLDQVAIAVLKYINGKRAETKLGGIIPFENFYAISKLDNVTTFFQTNIDAICLKDNKPGSDTTGRRPHLEYMVSAFLYFKHQLELSPTLDITSHQKEDFKILLTHFLSVLQQLYTCKAPLECYEINDGLVTLLKQESQIQIEEETLSEEGGDENSACLVSSNNPVENKKYSLIGFQYQTIASHLSSTVNLWGADDNSDIGNMGSAVTRKVFKYLVPLNEKDLRLQISEIISDHIVTSKRVVIEQKEQFDARILVAEDTVRQCRAESIEQKIEINDLKTALAEKSTKEQVQIEVLTTQVRMLTDKINSLENKPPAPRSLFGLGMFPPLPISGVSLQPSSSSLSSTIDPTEKTSSITELS